MMALKNSSVIRMQGYLYDGFIWRNFQMLGGLFGLGLEAGLLQTFSSLGTPHHIISIQLSCGLGQSQD